MMTKNLHITVDILNLLVDKWWLDAGSCLGVVRDKDFIKEDYDIDIGIISEFGASKDRIITNFESFGAKLVKERFCEGKLVTLGFKRFGVKLDLFFYHQQNGVIWHALYKHGMFYPVVFDARLFTGLKEVRFKGKTCYLPNPPEEYLEARYGEDWRTPKSIFRFWHPDDTKAINMGFFKNGMQL